MEETYLVIDAEGNVITKKSPSSLKAICNNEDVSMNQSAAPKDPDPE